MPSGLASNNDGRGLRKNIYIFASDCVLMIIVDVEVVFEDAGAIDSQGVREAFRVMDEASQKEEGCVKYVSSVDVNDPRVVRIYEVWESMEKLVPHFKTPHMTAFQAALGGVKTKSYVAKAYDVNGEVEFPN